MVLTGRTTPPELRAYLARGGRVLATGTTHPGLDLPRPVRLRTDTRSSYLRVEDHRILPSLGSTWTLFWEGDFLELEPVDRPALTLIPPGPFGPPDKVSTLSERTEVPGLVVRDLGRGRLAYLPWNVGDLYYRFGDDKHRLLVRDLVGHLLEGDPQLVTDAHPSVEITLLEQASGGRLLVHLVNLSGHAGNTFFEAVEMRDLSLRVRGGYTKARAVNLERDLPVDGSGAFVLPRLREHELIVLERSGSE